MMAIEMVGDVYCPLSSRDPRHRLHALVQQTQCRLVLVHHSTETMFFDDVVLINIDSAFLDVTIKDYFYLDRRSTVVLEPNDIAYIIFTRGSTGLPKPVSKK